MSEDTQTRAVSTSVGTPLATEPVEAKEVEETTKAEKPSVEVSELLNQATAKIQTLEQRLEEVQEQFKPQYQQVAPTDDLDKQIEGLVKAIRDEDDPDAPNKLKELMTAQQKANNQNVQTVLDYQNKEAELFGRKPHLSDFVDEIRNRVARDVDNGKLVDRALGDAEKYFDAKLAKLADKDKPEPKKEVIEEEKPKSKQPEGTMGRTDQNPTAPTPPAAVAQTSEQYLADRIANRQKMLNRPR